MTFLIILGAVFFGSLTYVAYCVCQLRGMRWSTQLWAPPSAYENVYGWRLRSSPLARFILGTEDARKGLSGGEN